MSLAQGFPSTFSDTQGTNEVLHNLDNETKKIYNDINSFMASDGHSHTGNGSDGAIIASVAHATAADSATKLTTARNINGVLFDGSADISITSGLLASSSAQAIAGTDNSVAITPLQLRNGLNASGTAPTYACRAWCDYNGVTNTIKASGNISSVIDNGVGDYTFCFINAMTDENYSIATTPPIIVDQGNAYNFGLLVTTPTSAPTLKSTTQVRMVARRDGNFDLADASMSVFR